MELDIDNYLNKAFSNTSSQTTPAQNMPSGKTELYAYLKEPCAGLKFFNYY